MLKIVFSALLSILLAVLVVTAWFMIFGFQGTGSLISEFVGFSGSLEYWAGIGIFSLIFFVFFTLPLSFLILKNK